jgi:hypothetical protein
MRTNSPWPGRSRVGERSDVPQNGLHALRNLLAGDDLGENSLAASRAFGHGPHQHHLGAGFPPIYGERERYQAVGAAGGAHKHDARDPDRSTNPASVRKRAVR